MSSEKQHSPQHKEILKKQALEQNEVTEVLNIIKKYAVPAAVAVLVVCGIFMFDRYSKASKVKKESKADAALMSAGSAADYEAVLDKYGSTSSAPIALMQLGMARFAEGDLDAAQKCYEDFLKKYAKHDMVPQAELNIITCREAKGEYSEAHLLYGTFVDTHKDSFLAPAAMMYQARCLEAMENPAEAKRTYEDLIMAYPGSSWANLAESKMTVLSSKMK
jgi:TolA-binding protein